MTPEEKLERVRMCVAEAGYDPNELYLDEEGFIRVLFASPLPLFISWRAGAIAGYTESCWPCVRARGWGAFPACGHPVDPFCAEDAEVSL